MYDFQTCLQQRSDLEMDNAHPLDFRPFPSQAGCFKCSNQFDPCISSVTRSIMITISNSPLKGSGIPNQFLVSDLKRLRAGLGWYGKSKSNSKSKGSHESEMARSSECTEQYAQKVLDTAGIVIALGKAWKRRNRR